MENNSNRRILLMVGIGLFFAIIVLVWYFVYAKPVIAPTLTETNDPLPTRTLPPRFQFINKIWGTEKPTTITEIVDPLKEPLIQVWNKPASGQTFISKSVLKEIETPLTEGTTTTLIKKTVRASSTVLTFVDRTTGYIYGYPVETGTIYQISNTVIPGIYDAYFFDNGRKVIMRYYDQDKKTIVGVIASVPVVSETSIALPLEDMEYLPGEVTSLTVNHDHTEISYIVRTQNGSSIYSIGKTNTQRFITSSPFREWTLSYGGNSLYVTTNPSAYVEGSTFSLPLFQAEMTEKTGLMSTPGTSGVLLNSMWGQKGLVTFLSDNGQIQVLPFTTLASKCAWGQRNFIFCSVPRSLQSEEEGLPDDWYQGRVSFSDDLITMNVSTSEQHALYSFTEEKGVFDIQNISLSDENDLVSFNKKQDATLWLLNTNLLQ